MSSIELLETISSSRNGDVLCCAFSGRVLAVGSACKLDSSQFFELPQSPLCAHSFAVYGCSFSKNCSLLATCSQDGRAFIWDVTTGRKLGQISHDTGMALKVCQFSPDGNLLATGSDDETACFWNVETKTLLSSLEGHESSVSAVAFSPDGTLLVTGSSCGDLRIWDSQFGGGRNLAMKKEAHDLGVTCSAFSPLFSTFDDKSPVYWLATGGNDDLVRIWRIPSDKIAFNEYTELCGHLCNVMCVAYSPDGHLLASGGGDKSVIVWDPIKGCKLHQLDHHQRYVTCVAFSGDGQLLVSGSNDKNVAIWRIQRNFTSEEIPSSIRSLTPGFSVEDPYPPFKMEKPADLWNTENVAVWVEKLVKNEQLGQVFRQNSIDGQELLLLTDTMLKNALGIDSLGERNRILREIDKLREQNGTNSSKSVKILSNFSDIPHEFRCPITHEIMADPVMASDGYTYERRAITDWMEKGHITSPMTNATLPHMDLTPNRMLKMLIQKIL